MTMNILLITLDQFRGDCLSIANHPVVRTPHLDRLCENGMRFSRHYSQSSPCGPGRASLYTGMYQMNHRVVANGTPLNDNFDNIARIGLRAGYESTLFGYTDQAIDPRVSSGPQDPWLSDYEAVLPGFTCALDLRTGQAPWVEWLVAKGFDSRKTGIQFLATEHERPVELSVSTFTTNHVIDWLGEQSDSWFAHVSYIRPHPPYSAAGHFSTMYSPDAVGQPIERAEKVHPFHETMLSLPQTAAPTDVAELAHMRSQYFGMISEVDAQVGRIIEELIRLDQWDSTVIVVTADHAELLGDHGLKEKVGYWETSQHIPCIVRDPRHADMHGTVVDRFTESIDIVPTLCDVMDQEIPSQCDGLPLTKFLAGEEPPWWRESAHWEYDWRFALIPFGIDQWPWRRTLAKQNLAVQRCDTTAYVQFGDGTYVCFDLASDPTWRTEIVDPVVIAQEAQKMLVWRMQHMNREHTGFLAENGGTGRWPSGVPWRQNI